MPEAQTIAITSLILNIVTLRLMIMRGVLSTEQMVENLDQALLALEEFIPVLGGDSKAVHGLLSSISGIVAGKTAT